MKRYVALLRAINVGRRKIAMAELREVAEAAGFTEVRTHLNSGNLIVATDGDAESVRTTLEPAIAERFGFDVPVIVRSADQLRAALAANPFPDADPSQLIIGFCAFIPPDGTLERMRELAGEQESVAIDGDTIYVDYAGGLARSKLAAAGDRGSGLVMTGRNLRTVQRLLELMS
ncbi:MAG TPA: DUF1697 domain-containing protein [Microlunatus sp.]|nr:DUF1697 domain-containing protein [Microlunatus sp.]